MEATLRLFKALPVDTHGINMEAFDTLASATVQNGFVFAPEVAAQYRDRSGLLSLVNELYGRNAAELNSAFHKSFAKVRDTPIAQLVYEQALHYLSTYGAARAGVYNEASIYIPAEALDVPDITGIRLVVIRGLTSPELKEELMKLLQSGIALSQQSVQDAITVAQFLGKVITADDVDSVKNREVQVALYDHFGLVPSNPVEFLRFAVYQATGETLLIKNHALTTKISDAVDARGASLVKYFDRYPEERLAEIFYRYKPILLAFRRNAELRKRINRVRRLAVKNHKPMPEGFLNTVTAKIAKREKISYDDFHNAMDQANIFRKIRLAYALNFRAGEPDSILYRVRNGKSFAKEFSFERPRIAEHAYYDVIDDIAQAVRPLVAGKAIHIPKGVHYALPATEKQFIGNLPAGTYVEVADDLVVGVHWNNVNDRMVDLDLSIANLDGKIGWDGSYRQGGTYFSGDMTSAPPPHGASEAFYIGDQGVWLMSVNYYNFYEHAPVPFKIFAARETQKGLQANRIVDPTKIVAASNAVIDVKQKVLGLIVSNESCKRFYFTEAEFMNGRTARHGASAEYARKYLRSYYEAAPSLNALLLSAGAVMVDGPWKADIDLSPEVVDKSTIINLLTGV